MPVYEYQCEKCQHTFTRLQKTPQMGFWQKLQFKCPQCHSRDIKRKFSSFGVNAKQSRADMLNDLSKMGPINFVPQYPGMNGPPPGGCPYANQESSATTGQNNAAKK